MQVRLALICSEYISMNVLSSELVSSNAGCRKMVENALHVKELMNSNRPPLPAIRNLVGRPRLPQAVLLATGGWINYGQLTNSIEAYDAHTNHWITLTDTLEIPCANHATVFLDGSVYCLGGFGSFVALNDVYRLNLSTCTWHAAAPMFFRRCYLCATLLEGYIYALGGDNGHEQLRTVECYMPNTNEWRLIPQMHEQRSKASCTTLHNKVGEAMDLCLKYNFLPI